MVVTDAQCGMINVREVTVARPDSPRGGTRNSVLGRSMWETATIEALVNRDSSQHPSQHESSSDTRVPVRSRTRDVAKTQTYWSSPYLMTAKPC
jgi:hypothetical protein